MMHTMTVTNNNPDTVWNRLARHLGRAPTNDECRAEIHRIIGEIPTPTPRIANAEYVMHCLLAGERFIVSDDTMDALLARYGDAATEPDDRVHRIRTKPNPHQVGTRDRWIAWIDQRDIDR